MSGRRLLSAKAKYGFNGQLKDNEVYGEGNSTTAEFWQYDPRLGRRWNIDPKTAPWESPYACFANDPIIMTDIHGDTPGGPNDKNKATQSTPVANLPTSQSSSCLTCGSKAGEGNLSAAISPGGSGVQGVKSQTNSNTIAVYDNKAPATKNSKPLQAAANLNTANSVEIETNNAEPASNEGMEFPGGEVGISFSNKNVPLGLSYGTSSGVGLSKDFGPISVSTDATAVNGVIRSQVFGSSSVYPSGQEIRTFSPYLVAEGNLIIKRVDVVDVVSTSSSQFISATNIQRYRTETFTNGVVSGPFKIKDSTQFNIGGSYGVSKMFGISISAPVLFKSNMPIAPVKPLKQLLN